MKIRNYEIGTLIEWAKLFEPLHQSILKTGGATLGEYDRIWHDYKDKVRPIIHRDDRDKVKVLTTNEVRP